MTTWNSRGWTFAIAIGLFGLLAPVEAYGACTNSDRAGTWQIYWLRPDQVDPGWTKCTVRVRPNGGGGNSCLGGATEGTVSFQTTGGNLSVRSNCAVKGIVQIAGCDFKLQGATMSKDGQKIAGVGSDCSGAGAFVFNFLAVKH